MSECGYKFRIIVLLRAKAEAQWKLINWQAGDIKALSELPNTLTTFLHSVQVVFSRGCMFARAHAHACPRPRLSEMRLCMSIDNKHSISSNQSASIL